jgi:hypothetical protein
MSKYRVEFRAEDSLMLGFTETQLTVGNNEGLFLGFKGICACFVDR